MGCDYTRFRQIINRKYWKAPLVHIALGISVYSDKIQH